MTRRLLVASALTLLCSGCVPGPAAYIGLWDGTQTTVLTFDDPDFKQYNNDDTQQTQLSIQEGSSADVYLPSTDGCSYTGDVDSGDIVFDESLCIVTQGDLEFTITVGGDATLNHRDQLNMNLNGPFTMSLTDGSASTTGYYQISFEGEKL